MVIFEIFTALEILCSKNRNGMNTPLRGQKLSEKSRFVALRESGVPLKGSQNFFQKKTFCPLEGVTPISRNP